MRFLFPAALLSVLGRQTYAAAADLCTIADLKVAIVNSKLFWMGGAYVWNAGVNGAQGNSSFLQSAEHNLYWQNLADSFSVNQFIPGATLGNSQVPADAPLGAAGSFFYDDTSLYLFAGLGSDPRVDNKLWSFNTSSNQWSQVSVDGGRFQHSNRYGGLHTSVPSAGLSYFTGGTDTSITGMVKFDSSSPDKPKWENQTDPDPSKGAAIPRIQGGEMVFVGLGKSGVLLAFGGYDTSRPGTQFGSFYPWDQRDMSQISVYDISSSTWYNVPATGNIPPKRSDFCAAVSAAPDNSSFQVAMYGGWDQASQSANEDLYVLTIPSFQWIKLDAHKGFDADGSGDAKGRSHHKCVTWNNAQMLVVGGMLDAGKGVLNNRSCDSNYLPWRVLDTSTYTWSTDFKKDANYTVPDVVTQVIGGSGAGGAVKKAPTAGWNNPQLESIFSQPSVSAPDGERTTPAQGGKGYIAGAVIGCFLAIGIIVGAFYIRRLRQRSKVAHYVEDLSGTKKRIDETPLEVWMGRNKSAGADARDEVFTVTNSYYEVHPESTSPKTGKHGRSNSTRANSLNSPGSKIPHPLDTSNALDLRGMQDQRSPMKKPAVPRTPAKNSHGDDEKLL